MSIQTFSVGIYNGHGNLVQGYLKNVHWDDIEEFVAEIEANNPGCKVDCVEHEPSEWESLAGEVDFQD